MSRNRVQQSSTRPTGLSRRHFLRGVGVAIALPAFESLARPAFATQTAGAALATSATGAPIRTAFIYFPNGAIPAAWWPTGEEASFALGKTLAPLASFRDQFNVLRGLDHNNAFGG